MSRREMNPSDWERTLAEVAGRLGVRREGGEPLDRFYRRVASAARRRDRKLWRQRRASVSEYLDALH
jgi:hypothetical protein